MLSPQENFIINGISQKGFTSILVYPAFIAENTPVEMGKSLYKKNCGCVSSMISPSVHAGGLS